MKNISKALILMLAACGSVDDGGPDDMTPDTTPDPSEPDVTAPLIVSMSPADGAVGIASDANVVIEFSEPMDQLSVQNSLDSADLGGIQYEWSNGGRTIRLIPNDPLVYAEGFGVLPENEEAAQFVVTVGIGATDEAGNPVEVGAQTSFTTLKSLTWTALPVEKLTAFGTPGEIVDAGGDFLYVGDSNEEDASSTYRSYVTMDLAELPEGAVAIESAVLSSTVITEMGAPYDAMGEGAGMRLDHVRYTLESEADINAAYNTEAMSIMGDFAQAGSEDVELDVTLEVGDDLRNRATREDLSQFRLRFDGFSNLDDQADGVILSPEFELRVVYLVP